MTYKKTGLYLSTLFMLQLIMQCSPPVTFDQPQPTNQKELSTFPKRIQGNYLSQDRLSILTISDLSAIRTYDFGIKARKDNLKNSYELTGDTLIEIATGKKQMAIIAGDTIFANNYGTDTLFYISETDVLKRFKGYYFLNTLYDKNEWTLQRLSLSNGILTLSEISDSVHINQLKEITETPEDTICSNFKLNQAQFKKFINNNGFDQSEQFTRLSGK